MPQYGETSYWNKRYQESNGETFDWLEDYGTLQAYINQNVEGIENPKILNLGCGNSILCEYLYDDGFKNIVNIDISEIVIEQMKERNKHRPNMIFQVMDALDLQFEDDSFDLIIDKSTIDAILCGNQSFSRTARMLKEAYRVLRNNGIYMVISYGEPNSRVWHLKREFLEFDVQIRKIEKEVQLYEDDQFKSQSLIHYIYNCRKLMTKAKQFYVERFEIIVKEIEIEELEQIKEESMANDELLDEIIKEYIDADNEEDFSEFIERIKPQQGYQQLLQDLGYL